MKALILPVLLLSLLPIVATDAAPVGWLRLDGAEYKRVEDPVFGGEVAVIEAGVKQADTVVLIHGLGDNASRDWKHVIPALAENYHVLALDLPGFGLSGKGNHLYSPERLARSVRAITSELASGPIVVIGHSMGAAVALAYTHLYPEQIEHLVLVDMAGVLHRSIYTAHLGMQGARWVIGDAIDEDSWLSDLVSDVATRVENAAITPTLLLNSAWLRARLLGGDPHMIAAYALVAHDFSTALWELDIPTLVIWGRRDAIAPLRTGRMVAGIVPKARLEVLDHVGHTPMLEAPDAFNDLVLRRLAGNLGSPDYKPAPRAVEDGGSLTCDGNHGKRFSGDISRLHLRDCAKTVVENANIGRLEIVGGTVEIVNSHVFEGIEATDSNLRITAGSVRGEPPMTLKDTNVDAAGTAFSDNGRLAENKGSLPVTLTFSVSRRASGEDAARFLHEIIEIPAGDAH
jgi:pimeloyl-ACP methyl ester carboxylesterase